jgi:hypothetical protein
LFCFFYSPEGKRFKILVSFKAGKILIIGNGNLENIEKKRIFGEIKLFQKRNGKGESRTFFNRYKIYHSNPRWFHLSSLFSKENIVKTP